MTQLSNILNQSSIAAFGMGMPALSTRWCGGDATDISIHEDRMALSVDSPTSWNAPLAGQLRKISAASDLRLTLIRADGSPLTDAGFLLILHQQAFLRLSRLYAQILENAG